MMLQQNSQLIGPTNAWDIFLQPISSLGGGRQGVSTAHHHGSMQIRFDRENEILQGLAVEKSRIKYDLGLGTGLILFCRIHDS